MGARKGNEQWASLSDEDRFQDADHLLDSYMKSTNKSRWRQGAKPKVFNAKITLNGKQFRFGKTNIRKLAKRLGISRKAAWDRVYNAKKAWGVTIEGAFALVRMGINHQSRSKLKIVPGLRFGRLTTVRVAEFEERPQNISAHHLKEHYWVCKCECGGEKLVSATHLRDGHTQSCGCIRREKAPLASKRYNLAIKRKKWIATMITIRRFLALLNPILDGLNVHQNDIELLDIRTEFNHGTGLRSFRITLQLPTGEQIVRVIDEQED